MRYFLVLTFTLCSFSFLAYAVATDSTATSYGAPDSIPENEVALFLQKKIYPKTNYWIDIAGGVGWVHQIPEGREVVHIGTYQAQSIRLSMQPSDLYGTLYRRARYGIAFYSASFKTKAIGWPYAIYPWFEIPIPEPTERQKISIGYFGGFGIAWNFVPYDPNSTAPNIYIGSRNNCYLEIGFYGSYHITRNVHIGLSTGLKHFSNGALRKPNKGINLIPITLSVRYQVNNRTRELNQYYNHSHIPDYKPHWRINVSAGGGLRQEKPGSPRYGKYTLSTNALYQISYKHRLGLGLDVFFADHPKQRSEKERSNFHDIVSPAVVLCSEWVLRKNVSIPIEVGVYALSPNSNNGEVARFYERVGVKINMGSKVYTAICIKAHRAQADFFELSLGYTFHKDKNSFALLVN